MKNTSKTIARCALLTGIAGISGLAQAHTGHETSSLMQGLVHPFGADHLLAMVAVGIWSVAALPAHKAWQGPAAFMLALLVSAVLGAMGVTVPFLEQAIALSVVLFGAMLVLSRQKLPVGLGLGLVAAAASLHGLAHGAETPASGFGVYALGFALTTATLHLGGVSLALAIQRTLARRATWALGSLGAGLGAAGLYLLGQVAA